ncbi:ROK family protein [Infirmifilum lucidum]|uniref:ROK family protein n=1 Tax=Infirmifilum lucidum TaxID=2776706 RepID=A0A7L9FKI3_9CREN|nr:ROK family protein [Infirmifilum lucidum]QOJ79454.1 ROK family protein [Infirmifilum lucidum]
MKYAIAVDIGATNTRVALGNSEGELLGVETFRTWDFPDPVKYIEKIARIISSLREKFKVDIYGIGVGTPGPLDVAKGEVLASPNMPFKRLEVVRLLKEFVDMPVAFANDAVAAAVGEKFWGDGAGVEDLVYVTISTGIGGGVYVDGSLLLGKDGNAHEIGHVVVDSQERLVCGCGGRGHWEAYSSGSGIPRFTKFLAERDSSLAEESQLARKSRIEARDVFEAYRAGDKLARAVILEVKKFNAYGFAAITNYYDPELITVGGSVALNNADIVLSGLEGDVRQYAINRVPRIKLTRLGANVGLMGALALGLGFEKKIPLR